MTKLAQLGPRPRARVASPSYPRKVLVAASALLLGACGGAVSPIDRDESSFGTGGAGGTEVQPHPSTGGSGGADWPPLAGGVEPSYTGGSTGTGGEGGAATGGAAGTLVGGAGGTEWPPLAGDPPPVYTGGSGGEGKGPDAGPPADGGVVPVDGSKSDAPIVPAVDGGSEPEGGDIGPGGVVARSYYDPDPNR